MGGREERIKIFSGRVHCSVWRAQRCSLSTSGERPRGPSRQAELTLRREHQIGLYQGANMSLLKTVFEVNLGLFGGGGESNKPKWVRE